MEVLWLGHADCHDVHQVGTKAAHLSRLAYRQRQGSSITGAHLAVLVQQLVPADVSAMVFSANPVTGCDEEVMINASWGLGESLVSGTVTPDTYMVRKSDMAIACRDIAEKRRMTVLAQRGTCEVPVPRKHQKTPSIEGFSTAMEQWSCPFGAQCRAINYYGFFTIKPFDLGAEMKQARVARYQEQLRQVLPCMGELWEQTWLPAILPGLDKARTTDFMTLNDDALLRTLDSFRRTINVIDGGAGYPACPIARPRHQLPSLVVARYHTVPANPYGYDREGG
jgi:Pyruvate phosphate dikinase, AMP/ATP-binding domain